MYQVGLFFANSINVVAFRCLNLIGLVDVAGMAVGGLMRAD